MTAAGICLLLGAGLVLTRYGRLQLAIWLLRVGTALVDAGTRIIEARRQ